MFITGFLTIYRQLSELEDIKVNSYWCFFCDRYSHSGAVFLVSRSFEVFQGHFKVIFSHFLMFLTGFSSIDRELYELEDEKVGSF